MNTTPILDPPSAAATAVPRRAVFPFDPVLALGTIALAVCSLVVISGATRGDIPGDPNYYVTRQGVYFGVGLVDLFLAVVDVAWVVVPVDAVVASSLFCD